MRRYIYLSGILALTVFTGSAPADQTPTRKEAARALKKAATFFCKEVASHGGYVWKYSGDLQLRQGEGVATKSMIWIQPPGTPLVGEAFLEAYGATGDKFYLHAAREVAYALVKGQLQSGGWYYHVEFDPKKRGRFSYWDGKRKTPKAPGKDYVGGWDVWKKRRNRGNITVIDDDVTPAAMRLLMRVDKALDFKDRDIHSAVMYAISSTLKAQYPNGAWSHNYDRLPPRNTSADHYPVKKASYPEKWSRTWTKDWTGCYSINDRITLNMIKTFLVAHDIYGKKEYLQAAERGGRFLLLAQMPDPQPAWAQQYNRDMHPVWDRKFEPPAITGMESQDALETLLLLYRKTGNKKYLEPVPRALDYLKKSRLADGRLARFYELKTNRPLYFTRKYRLTHDSKEAPKHYAFKVNSRLERIEREYQHLLASQGRNPKALEKKRVERITPQLAKKVRQIVDTMDGRGAWVEKGWIYNLDQRKVIPKSGIIYSQTFVDNVRTLCRYIRAAGKEKSR